VFVIALDGLLLFQTAIEETLFVLRSCSLLLERLFVSLCFWKQQLDRIYLLLLLARCIFRQLLAEQPLGGTEWEDA